MKELRHNIAMAIDEAVSFSEDGYISPDSYRDAADAILALPEIREALAYRNAVLASRLPDLPAERVGEIIRDLANRVAD